MTNGDALARLLEATHDLLVAGEMLAEFSDFRAHEAPEDYETLWRERADIALGLVRKMRYPNVHGTEGA